MPKYKNPESVLILIGAVKTQQVLLLNRVDWPGFWQSVTGSIEIGETPEQAAVRELFEETGLTSARLKSLNHHVTYDIFEPFRHRYAPGVTQNREHWFLLPLDEPVDIQCSPLEHSEYQWVDRDQAIAMVKSPSNQAIITSAMPRA